MGAATSVTFAGFGVHEVNLSGDTIYINGKPYYFQKRLGAGAFGAVYSARPPAGRNVAIKVVEIRRGDGGQVLAKAYLNEVRHLQRLRKVSHHVVRIHDFGFDMGNGRAFIIMDLGDENLQKFLERTRKSDGHMDPTIRKNMWRQIVKIVNTLTTNDVVHMDLKPDNLILFGKTLKIGDLGISKKTDMLHHARVGTPHYSAPEIMQDVPGHQHRFGPKADVWSCGAILYYMTYNALPNYVPNAAEPPHGKKPSRDPDVIDMLRRTLVLDVHRRADINEVLRHRYTTR